MSAQPQTVPDGEPEPVRPYVSLEDYFAQERLSEERHEYVDGVIVAMAGETAPHNEVAGNIYTELKIAFRGRSCKVYFENIQIRVSSTQYRYPDVVALCGIPDFDNRKPPNLLNPQVIFEVLSPSTEEFDRNGKWMEYKQIPSLMDYVLVSQDKVNVVHFARQTTLQWSVNEYNRRDDVITLVPLGLSLPLAAIYQEIEI